MNTYGSDIPFAALATSFRDVNGKFFKVRSYLKLPVNFAAGILQDTQFSASNTSLNDINMCLYPFLRQHKFGN